MAEVLSSSSNVSVASPPGINPLEMDQKPAPKVYTDITSFDEMGLSDELLRGIYAYGFQTPSYIQQKAIVPLVDGRDVIAQSQSGTGKTGAFSIGTLARIIGERRYPQAIIVSPTRELAEQTFTVIKELSQKMTFAAPTESDPNRRVPLNIHLCIGGTRVNEDVKDLRNSDDAPTQVICGTPGRILDLIIRRAINTKEVRIMVIDEADEMLSQGFKDQIYDIFKELPNAAQIALFSATLPPDVLELTKHFMRNPVEILVKSEALTLEGIKQVYVELREEEWKFDTLMDIYGTLSLKQSIVFVNTRRKCEWLADNMRKREFTVAEIHANLPPAERKQIMKDFKSGSTRVLLTTDLMARGIDVQQVSLIVNYDMPTSIENYIHRIGRSGRYGRKGLAINFVTKTEMPKLDQLRTFYQTEIVVMPANIQSLF